MIDKSKKLTVVNTDARTDIPSDVKRRMVAGGSVGNFGGSSGGGGSGDYLSSKEDDTAEGVINFSKGLMISETLIDDVIKSGEKRTLTDNSVMTSKRISEELKSVEGRFIRKDQDDRTPYKVSSDKGFEVGTYINGMIGGQGGYYYKDENGKVVLELDKIHAREELIVPKISFNCIDVVTGEKAQTFAYGTIKSVDTENRIATLDLLEGEYGTLHEDDICRGIFHFLDETNNTEYSEDSNGFHNYSGFSTSYFTPTEIIENVAGSMSFRYDLQDGTTVHPTPGMNFYAYGNFEDVDRQSITYDTRNYTRRLVGVDTWVINPDTNIAMQDGLLEGLTIGGFTMHGYGTFQTNSYFTGVQIQFTPEQLEELKGQSSIVVDLSNDTISIACDQDGAPTETVSSGNPKTTTLKVYYGLVKQELASLSASSHTGITISTDYSTGLVKVTGITSSAADTTEVTLTAEVEINGEYEVVSKVFTINKVKQGGQGGQGEAASYYSVSPSNLPLSLSVTGSLTPSSATFTCYKNTGTASQNTETAYWYVYTSGTGEDGSWGLYESSTSKYSATYTVNFTTSHKFYKIVAKPYSTIEAVAYAAMAEDGAQGATGAAGVSPRYCGIYKSDVTYEYNQQYRDIVIHDGLVYQVKTLGASLTGRTPSQTSSYWETANKFSFVAMDTALADSANIAGLIFQRVGYDSNGNPMGILKSQAKNSDISWVNNGSWVTDGIYRKSPSIGANGFTKEIITITATKTSNVVITMVASSEASYDYGYIGKLDTTYTTRSEISSNYLARVSGTESLNIVLTIPSGTHRVEIIYSKDSSGDKNEDCVRYVVEAPTLMINGADGSIMCTNVNLSGVINATGGTFKDIDIESAYVTGELIVEIDSTKAVIGVSETYGFPAIEWISEDGTLCAHLGTSYSRGVYSPELFLRSNDNEATDIYPGSFSIDCKLGYAYNYRIWNTSLEQGVLSGYLNRIREVASTTTLSAYDHTVICTNSSTITITFPSDACVDGKEYWLFAGTGSTVRVTTASGSISGSGASFSAANKWHIYKYYSGVWYYSYTNN